MVAFNFTYDPGVTIQQALGFEIAGRIWSHFLSDPVTLNIHVGVSSDLPANVIGGALPGILAATPYSTFRNQIHHDRTSTDDLTTALDPSSLSAKFELSLNGTNQALWASSSSLNVTRAGGKALGIIAGNTASLDGAIVMGSLANSQFHWNYDFTRSSATTSGSLDFLSVVLHEIGHILGFISSVDKPGMMSSLTTNMDQMSAYRLNATERVTYATPLDMFRVDTNAVRDLTYGSVGGGRGFAPQGMGTMIAQFSTGKNTTVAGDGYQASHWKEQITPLGIMDPAVAPQERVSISNLDLRAFDVIGWNLRNGLSASAFSPSFLSNFRTQAVQALGQRLGQTTTWINSNLTITPANLGSDRTADVEAMIQNSQVYEWGTAGSGTTSTSGRRWMEIFNQMASNQEVYVNFSTVSTVAPAPENLEANGTNWGTSGSGKISPSGRVWSENTTLVSGASDDEILGLDTTASLVSLDASNYLNFNNSAAVAIADAPSTSSNVLTGTLWAPVSTQMTENTFAGAPASAAGSDPHQQFFNLVSTGINILLGVESNPLAQGVASAGLLGAIV